jgi:hypothetical protein
MEAHKRKLGYYKVEFVVKGVAEVAFWDGSKWFRIGTTETMSGNEACNRLWPIDMSQ